MCQRKHADVITAAFRDLESTIFLFRVFLSDHRSDRRRRAVHK